MMGSHCLKSWSTTQATIALSSAETELYALLKASTQTLGLLAIAEDFGYVLQAAVHTDASATMGIVNRQGLGKLRHIGVQYLWLQEKSQNGELQFMKVAGAENPADLCTKHLGADVIQHLIGLINAETTSDRASSAPALASLTTSRHGGEQRPQDHWMTAADGTGGREMSDPDRSANVLGLSRKHEKPRRHLFTPRRIEGAPPAKALTPTRLTIGRFVDSGEEFSRLDSWRSRSDAHLDMGRIWVGETRFFAKSQSS